WAARLPRSFLHSKRSLRQHVRAKRRIRRRLCIAKRPARGLPITHFTACVRRCLMKVRISESGSLFIALSLLLITGCRTSPGDRVARTPPAHVQSEDFSVVEVEHPEQFPLVTAIEYVPPLASTITCIVVRQLAYAANPSVMNGTVVEIQA